MIKKITLIQLSFIILLPFLAYAKKTTSTKKEKKIPLRKRQAVVLKQKKAENKTMSHMNFQELEVLKKRLVEEKSYAAAIKAIEKQEKQCKDSDIMATLMLEKADLYLKQGSYQIAGDLYKTFLELYPGNPHVEKAHYLATKCFEYRMLDAERDQSNTQLVIDLCDQYLERAQIYTTYLDEIKQIRTKCYQLLVESEVNVFEFYLKSNKFVSAQTRLNSIKKDYLEEMPDIEPLVMTLDVKLAQAQNKPEESKEKQHQLEEKYPTVSAIQVAKNTNKKSKIDRF